MSWVRYVTDLHKISRLGLVFKASQRIPNKNFQNPFSGCMAYTLLILFVFIVLQHTISKLTANTNNKQYYPHLYLSIHPHLPPLLPLPSKTLTSPSPHNQTHQHIFSPSLPPLRTKTPQPLFSATSISAATIPTPINLHHGTTQFQTLNKRKRIPFSDHFTGIWTALHCCKAKRNFEKAVSFGRRGWYCDCERRWGLLFRIWASG